MYIDLPLKYINNYPQFEIFVLIERQRGIFKSENSQIQEMILLSINNLLFQSEDTQSANID